ncbi:protein C12orf4 homolog isoform X2 [Plodia interpunctella]|uniref:protein C12orf4 homolog isoform X2 n=1 Tax=Plodia interpunctella TaxID=58824 RepID=UPI002368AAB2|nr:protein C12orf4 homolog isoform X2 [Plodia interpunctella]
MSAEVAQNPSRNFKYSFPTCSNEDILFKLEIPVEIPYAGCTRELVQRVINMFHIPVYLEDDLNEKLADFVTSETKNFHNERDAKLINQLKNSELNVDGIVKNWERMFKENVMEFAEQKGTSDEEVFAAAYHKLVHSPALETILQVENSYAKTVSSMLKNMDEDVQKITERQQAEMEENMRLLNSTVTEDDINELAARHFEEQSLVSGRWGSQLDALRQTQRSQHRAWLMASLDHYSNTTGNSPLSPLDARQLQPAAAARPPPPPPPRLEESFTIHLGSQLKQTHNVRIVAMDLLDLCRLQPDNPAEDMRRLQTSLGLYSSQLSGAVLLSAGPPAALQRAAAAAPEHHFASLDLQLKEIAEKVKEPAEKRNEQRSKDARRSRHALQTGDVFVTRHSNLADVHVVFHLVADEDALAGDISSRHAVILGLRNILKAACAHDVTTISLPLLLRHDLSEETTAAWCARRAELVLKCVKGFVLEAFGWGGARPATLQVAAPPNTQPQVFAQLAQLLPTIFRVSAPVKAKQPAAQ